MTGHLFRFELRYWLRQPLTYLFIAAFAGLPFLSTAFERFSIGTAGGNVHRNAPSEVYGFYGWFALFSLLTVTAVVNATAIRDFSSNTTGIVFSTPLKKRAYLLGRFLGCTLVAALPMTGISLGIIAGGFSPTLRPDQVGPVFLLHHAQAFLLLGLPTVLFISAVIFAVALHVRSTTASFVTAIGLFVCYTGSQALMANIDDHTIAALLDPFGRMALWQTMKYWTVADKNTAFLPMDGVLLWNRLFWATVSIGVFALAYARFSFHAQRGDKAPPPEGTTAPRSVHGALPPVNLDHGTGAAFAQYQRRSIAQLVGILKEPAFVVVMLLGIVALVYGLVYRTVGYGLHTYPITYAVIDVINGPFVMIVVIVMTYYSGALVQADREARVDELLDAAPVPSWVAVLSRYTALFLLLIVLYTVAAFVGIAAQLASGHHRIQPLLYLRLLIIPNVLQFAISAMLAMLVHTVLDNKYAGYAVFIAVFFLNALGWRALHVESGLLIFNKTPRLDYSDISGFGPYLRTWSWSSGYWWLFGCLLLVVTYAFHVRGRATDMRSRLRLAAQRLRGSWRVWVPLLFAWLLVGGWCYYNTDVLNKRVTQRQLEAIAVRYENGYKRFEHIPQPDYAGITYTLDLYPEERRFAYTAAAIARNNSSVAIDSIHLLMPPHATVDIDMPGARQVLDDADLHYRIFRLDEPLLPGAELRFTVKGAYIAKGFENEVTFTHFVENGTFFDQVELLPNIGYSSQYELDDPAKRRNDGLPPRERMPALSEERTPRMRSPWEHSGWVEVRTTISTSPDQIAVAPGSLQKEWTTGGRRYFTYVLDHASTNFLSFCSARYAVARSTWQGIALEVYHQPEHAVNVPRMLKALARSLAYCTAHYGPYAHRQARVIEFPRYEQFAQAFPGTMPYSEGLGFMADLSRPEDLDMVFFTIAHETAHQWWGHQVLPAYMQGFTFVTESMAEYSALVITEQEYGPVAARTFLRYENDLYQRARGGEQRKELPLMQVEDQEYIHYRKGSIVLYGLRHFVGADALDKAFRTIVQRFAYRPPPYATAWDLYRELRAVTPDSLHYLLDDGLKYITRHDQRLIAARSTALSGGGYAVTLTITAAKSHADSLGHEWPVPMDDWMDVGFFDAPAKGRQVRVPSTVQRVRLHTGTNTITVRLPKEPYDAMVDPYFLFFDRKMEDNLKRVERGPLL